MTYPLFLFLFACGEETTKFDTSSEEIQAVDHRESYPETTAQLIFSPPDYEIPPYADVQTCWYTTYTGEDIAIVGGSFRQSEQFGHHVILMRTRADEDDVPDGTIEDCSETGDMTDMDPFVLPSNTERVGLTHLELPAGMGNKLKSGQRILVQSHHVNYTGDTILVNDRIELETAPVDGIENFVAPLAHTSTNLNIESGLQTREITCAFEEDHNFLYLLGHMHEWGTSISIDYNKEDGSVERLYEISEWDVLYRDIPPIIRFGSDTEYGELQVKAGESFTTTCNWNNDTDETLHFPHEMCVATALVYPATISMICDVD